MTAKKKVTKVKKKKITEKQMRESLLTQVEELNEEEQNLLKRVHKRTTPRRHIKEKSHVVKTYLVRGQRTQCMLVKDGWEVFTGHADRNPVDPMDEATGKRIAFTRAAENMFKQSTVKNKTTK